MTSSFKDSPSLTALLLKATPCTLQLEEDFKPRPFKPFLFQDPSNPVTLQRLFKPLHSNPPVFSAAASSAESACASWMASKALKANPQKANFESSSTCNVVC